MSRSSVQAALGVGVTARAVAARHPRHVLLFALVVGLLLGPVSAPAVLMAAAGALLGPGRLWVGVAASAAVVGGASIAAARLDSISDGTLPGLTGRTLEGSAVLLEPVRKRPTGQRAARMRLIDGPARGDVAAARVGTGVPWPDRVSPGAIVAVRGTVEPLRPFEAYQRRRGAVAALELSAGRDTGRRRRGAAGLLDAVRGRAERALTRGLPVREAGLLRGMVLGQDEGLDEPTREEFRRTGLAHLVAASGQNVMLLAVLAIAVGTALGAGLRLRLAAALLLIVAYVPLAGGGPSIQRAGVMGAAGLVAALAGRPASRWYALGLAAAVTLVANPMAAGEPGWQLSFAAVVALLAVAPHLREWLGRRGCPSGLADVTAITVSATLGTAPLMAHHFEAISLASLPSNLLAAPAVAPVMWLGMLAAAVGQVSAAAAAPIGGLAAYPVAYVEWVAHVVGGLPSASVPVRLPALAGVVAAYGALLAGGLGLRALTRRAVRPGGGKLVAAAALTVVVAGAAIVRATGPPARAAGELVVSFLDVGQGDATLLQYDDIAALVDTGPPGGPILARLREAGVGRLDLLVLTHAQADHEGMAPAVLAAHPTRLVLNGGGGVQSPVQRALPGLAARAGARILPAEVGQDLRMGGLELRVLWPPPPLSATTAAEGDPNDRAVVSHVRLGSFDLLLPADAESGAIAAAELPRVEALKVAHHGSADEGLAGELERLRPAFAAIEVGAHNSYGHPTPSTLATLHAAGATVMRTDRDGTIRLRVTNGRMRVDASRG